VGAELPFRSLRTDRKKPTENCLRGPRYTFLPDVAIGLCYTATAAWVKQRTRLRVPV
jgi:hypothetical protein